MASILITGNTRLFTRECLELLAEEYKIVITGDFKMAGILKMFIYIIQIPWKKSSVSFLMYIASARSGMSADMRTAEKNYLASHSGWNE